MKVVAGLLILLSTAMIPNIDYYGSEKIASARVVIQQKDETIHKLRIENQRLRYRTLPSRSGSKAMYRVTAYCLPGRTASGTAVRLGTCAVDPAHIPFGTMLYVPGYGYARAEDTGGVIKGNVIDVWLPSRSACMQWGAKRVLVTRL